MLAYLRLEALRIARDRRFLFFTILAPLGYYLLFTSVGDTRGTAEGVDVALYFMISMASFGVIGGSVVAGGSVANDRASGWVRQLQIMPLSATRIIVAKVLAQLVTALPVILAIFVAASAEHHVRLAVWQWIALAGLLWTGAAPFAALGLAIGYASTPQSAHPTLVASMLLLTILGGIWFPISNLPGTLRRLAAVLPSRRYAQAGWSLAAGHTPALADVLVLAAWFIVLAAVAGVAYRRARTRA
jgi:ABC-2 type transport system permease protein